MRNDLISTKRGILSRNRQVTDYEEQFSLLSLPSSLSKILRYLIGFTAATVHENTIEQLIM